MTYKSRGRTMTEVIMAVILIFFLIGFVAVLCIGNYYRALRAMERQRQKRLAKLASGGGNGVVGMNSPAHSSASSQFSIEERQGLLGQSDQSGGIHLQSQRQRRRNAEEGTDSLLFDVHDPGRAQTGSV